MASPGLTIPAANAAGKSFLKQPELKTQATYGGYGALLSHCVCSNHEIRRAAERRAAEQRRAAERRAADLTNPPPKEREPAARAEPQRPPSHGSCDTGPDQPDSCDTGPDQPA